MKKAILILSSLFISIFVFTQDYEVTFTAFGIASEVDSVQIENVSQGKSISVVGTDVLHLLGSINELDNIVNNQQFMVYPNPANDYANVAFYSNTSEDAEIKIFDVSGKLIVKQAKRINQGSNSFRLSGLQQGMYIVSIYSANFSFSERLVITNSSSNQVRVQTNIDCIMRQKAIKSSKSVIPWQYDDGDILVFKGFSGGHSRIYVYYVSNDLILNFDFVLCQDADGYKYPVTTINSITYMAENLQTSRYNNNSPIPEVTDNTEWSNLTTGGRCYYDNDSAQYASLYGALYNFAAINTGNICPIGWHVPTETEWQDLVIYLQNSGYNYTGFVDTDNDYNTNNYISKSLSATSLWNTTDVSGTPGNTDYPNYRNRSGFSAIGAGMRNPAIGNTTSLGTITRYWSSTILNEGYAKGLSIQYDNEAANIGSANKTFGQSVRCIKD